SMPVQQGRFGLQDALRAQEAFLVSSARLAQPIAVIGEVALPAAPGPRTRQAQQAIARAMAPAPAFAAKLNEQIANEFAAHQQYVACAVYYDSEALPQLAGFFYRQAL